MKGEERNIMGKSELNLFELTKLLYNKSKFLEKPYIQEDLGSLIVASTGFKLTGENRYKELAQSLSESFVEKLTVYPYRLSMLEGLDGAGWVLQYVSKCQIMETSETYHLLYPHLEKSLQNSIEENDFDFLYGATGKINLLINAGDGFLTKDICDLYITHVDKYYSITEAHDLPERIDIATAHGLASILRTLGNIYKVGYNSKVLRALINRLIDFYLSNVVNHPYISFGDYYYPKTKKIESKGMLAWCYGDLGIIYSLLYATSVVGRENDSIIPLVRKLSKRNIQNSSLVEFDEYNFYNTSFCHGISGIYMLLYKINNYVPVTESLRYWKQKLVENFYQQLKFKNEKVYFPKTLQNEEYSYTIEEVEFLNGMVGTILTLFTIEYQNDEWSSFIL